MLIFEEALKVADVELTHGVNPDSAVGFVPIKVLHAFEDID